MTAPLPPSKSKPTASSSRESFTYVPYSASNASNGASSLPRNAVAAGSPASSTTPRAIPMQPNPTGSTTVSNVPATSTRPRMSIAIPPLPSSSQRSESRNSNHSRSVSEASVAVSRPGGGSSHIRSRPSLDISPSPKPPVQLDEAELRAKHIAGQLAAEKAQKERARAAEAIRQQNKLASERAELTGNTSLGSAAGASIRRSESVLRSERERAEREKAARMDLERQQWLAREVEREARVSAQQEAEAKERAKVAKAKEEEEAAARRRSREVKEIMERADAERLAREAKARSERLAREAREERKETERREAVRREERERQEAERREKTRREADRKEKERREVERKDKERRDVERYEAERREAERKEKERKDMERKDKERKEVERREKERREKEREAERREAAERERKNKERQQQQQQQRDEQAQQQRAMAREKDTPGARTELKPQQTMPPSSNTRTTTSQSRRAPNTESKDARAAPPPPVLSKSLPATPATTSPTQSSAGNAASVSANSNSNNARNNSASNSKQSVPAPTTATLAPSLAQTPAAAGSQSTTLLAASASMTRGAGGRGHGRVASDGGGSSSGRITKRLSFERRRSPSANGRLRRNVSFDSGTRGPRPSLSSDSASSPDCDVGPNGEEREFIPTNGGRRKPNHRKSDIVPPRPALRRSASVPGATGWSYKPHTHDMGYGYAYPAGDFSRVRSATPRPDGIGRRILSTFGSRRLPDDPSKPSRPTISSVFSHIHNHSRIRPIYPVSSVSKYIHSRDRGPLTKPADNLFGYLAHSDVPRWPWREAGGTLGSGRGNNFEYIQRKLAAEQHHGTRALVKWRQPDWWRSHLRERLDRDVPKTPVDVAIRRRDHFALEAKGFEVGAPIEDGKWGRLTPMLETALSVLHILRAGSTAFNWELVAPQGVRNPSNGLVDGYASLALTDGLYTLMVVMLRPPGFVDFGVMREFTSPRTPWTEQWRSEEQMQAVLLQAQMYDECTQHATRYVSTRHFILTTIKFWAFGTFTPGYSEGVVSPVVGRQASRLSVMQCLVGWILDAWDANAMEIERGPEVIAHLKKIKEDKERAERERGRAREKADKSLSNKCSNDFSTALAAAATTNGVDPPPKVSTSTLQPKQGASRTNVHSHVNASNSSSKPSTGGSSVNKDEVLPRTSSSSRHHHSHSQSQAQPQSQPHHHHHHHRHQGHQRTQSYPSGPGPGQGMPPPMGVPPQQVVNVVPVPVGIDFGPQYQQVPYGVAVPGTYPTPKPYWGGPMPPPQFTNGYWVSR